MKQGDLINGQYELCEALKTGVGTEVWRVKDRRLERECVLKMPSDPPASEGQVESYLKEARAMARISDKSHVVDVYESGVWEGRPYFTQELLPGGSLAKRIRDAGGRLPMSEALRIGIEICEGVMRAHEAKLMHGDLKPENVAFTAQDSAKVVDFGTARWLDRETQPFGAVMATLRYQAPEQFSSKRFGDLDHRTDIWQIGVILAEMLGGRHPYDFTDFTSYTDAWLAVGRPPDLRHVPSECRDLIAKCLQSAKKDRYQHVSHLLADLRGILEQAQASVPGRARALGEEARRAYEAGDFARATLLFEELSGLRPTVHVLNWLGMTYECLREFGRARSAYTEAVELDPDNSLARANLKRLDEQHPPEPVEKLADKLITCGCGTSFTWTREAQVAFAEKGWDPPKRCWACRDKKKEAQAKRVEVTAAKPAPPVRPTPASEARPPAVRHVGRVKKVGDNRDWGFIEIPDMPDLYFHITGVRGGTMPRQNSQVLFEVGGPDRNGKPMAVNVEVL